MSLNISMINIRILTMIKNQIYKSLSIGQNLSSNFSTVLSQSNSKYNLNMNNLLLLIGEENLRLRWKTITKWSRSLSGKAILIRRGLRPDRPFGLRRSYLRA